MKTFALARVNLFFKKKERGRQNWLSISEFLSPTNLVSLFILLLTKKYYIK